MAPVRSAVAGGRAGVAAGSRARSTSSTRPTSSSRSTPTSWRAEPANVRYTTRLRRPAPASPKSNTSMNRLYAIESTPTLTGAKADHRLPVAASEVEGIARELAAAIAGSAAPAPSRAAAGPPDVAKWVAADRQGSPGPRGRSVVVAGEFQPAAVHAARPRDQPGARQHRHDGAVRRRCSKPKPHRAAARSPSSATAMDAGQVELLRDHGRQSRCSPRPSISVSPSGSPRSPLVVYHATHVGRDVAALPLEHRRDTPARELGRCARRSTAPSR